MKTLLLFLLMLLAPLAHSATNFSAQYSTPNYYLLTVNFFRSNFVAGTTNLGITYDVRGRPTFWVTNYPPPVPDLNNLTNVLVTSSNTTDTPLIVRNAPGNTNLIFSWTDTNGFVLGGVVSGGIAGVAAVGSVGIGTTRPARTLHVIGAGIISERTNSDPQLVLRNSGTTPQDWNFRVTQGKLVFRDNTWGAREAFTINPNAMDGAFVLSTNGVNIGAGVDSPHRLTVQNTTGNTNLTLAIQNTNGLVTSGINSNGTQWLLPDLGVGWLSDNGATRISRSLANQIGVVINGTERFRFGVGGSMLDLGTSPLITSSGIGGSLYTLKNNDGSGIDTIKFYFSQGFITNRIYRAITNVGAGFVMGANPTNGAWLEQGFDGVHGWGFLRSMADGSNATTQPLVLGVNTNEMIKLGTNGIVTVKGRDLNQSVTNLDGATNGLTTRATSVETRATNLEGATNGLTTRATNLEGATNGLNAADLNLQGATNGLTTRATSVETRATNLEGATNGLRAADLNLQGATNGLNAADLNLQGATNGLTTRATSVETRATNLEGATNGLRAADLNLQGATNGLNAADLNLQGATNGLTTRATSVETRATNLEGATNGLNTSALNLTGATNGIRTDILNLQAATNALSGGSGTDIANLQGATNGLTTRATNLEGATNGLTTRATNLEGATNGLTTRATNLEGATNGLTTRATTVETRATNLEGATNGLTTRATNLEGATNGLTARATNLEGATNGLTTRATTVETRATNLEGATNGLTARATNLEGATNGLTTRATNLEGATNGLANGKVNNLGGQATNLAAFATSPNPALAVQNATGNTGLTFAVRGTNGIATSGINSNAGSWFFPSGTALEPSIQWTADADGSGTGFYRAATDGIGFTTQGTEKMRLTTFLSLGPMAAYFGPNMTTGDAGFARDGPGILSFVNAGASALTNRVYRFHNYISPNDASGSAPANAAWLEKGFDGVHGWAFLRSMADGVNQTTQPLVLGINTNEMLKLGTNGQTTVSGTLTVKPTNNQDILYLGNQSVTGSSAANGLTIDTTWNTSASPLALKINVTNTASGSTAMGIALVVNNGTAWAVNKAGESQGTAFNSLFGAPLQMASRFGLMLNIDSDNTATGVDPFRITTGSGSYGNGVKLFEVINSGVVRSFGSLVLPNTNAIFVIGSYTNVVTDAVVYLGPASARTNWLNSTTATNGTMRWVKDRGTAAGTNLFIRATSGTIDGQASYTISANFDAVLVQYDGTNWWTLSHDAGGDLANLQGATNGLTARATNLEGATNGLRAADLNLQGATNGLTTRATNLEGATNGLDARATTLEGATSGLTTRASALEANTNAFTYYGGPYPGVNTMTFGSPGSDQRMILGRSGAQWGIWNVDEGALQFYSTTPFGNSWVFTGDLTVGGTEVGGSILNLRGATNGLMTMPGPWSGVLWNSNGVRQASDKLVFTNGFLGLNKPLPEYPLDVIGTVNIAGGDLVMSNYVTTLKMQGHSLTAGAGPQLVMQRYRGPPSSFTTLVAGDRLGSLEWWGFADTAQAQAVMLEAKANGDFNANASPGVLTFLMGKATSAISKNRVFALTAYQITNNAAVYFMSNAVYTPSAGTAGDVMVSSDTGGTLVWSGALNTRATNLEAATNALNNPLTQVAGVGGANTNFTLLATQRETWINGFTNVSIRAVMGWDAQARNWQCTITNGSGTTRTLEFSAVSNLFRFNGTSGYGTNAPNTLTNNTTLLLNGRTLGSNTLVSYQYFPWP